MVLLVDLIVGFWVVKSNRLLAYRHVCFILKSHAEKICLFLEKEKARFLWLLLASLSTFDVFQRWMNQPMGLDFHIKNSSSVKLISITKTVG